jgi:hypothetical protein
MENHLHFSIFMSDPIQLPEPENMKDGDDSIEVLVKTLFYRIIDNPV